MFNLTTDRTEKLNDQAALCGHKNKKIVETTFPRKEKKPRIIEN